MERTLLLNASYEPISVISAQRAVRLLFLGKVIVVSESNITWRSVSIAIKVPSIVRMVNYVRGLSGKRDVVRLTRKNIMIRDKYTCQYCGTKKGPEHLNIDHIIPKSQGGKSEWLNLVASCVKCNNKKDCRTPSQAGMTLLKIPKKPDFFIFTVHKGYKNIPKDWLDYCYWNVELDEE
jgi:5-methylcytosine-specific restriction endonuclease McrA